MTFPLLSADPGFKARKEQLERKKKLQKEKLEREKSPEMIKRRTEFSGTWICNNCTWTGDFFFMDRHPCKYNSKNNFQKVARRLTDEYEERRRYLLQQRK